ncbi:uncharacterized protein [Physcomitrium patens]|uniref:4-hydroxy-4-methyl-2-oxoglutarate aldolase n=1 Tax=Physcomitrium patens TaxID=3218 RepID=A9T923_PHYPA|nr:uncharacterized protein LOC112282840 [Physcomitrium patens]|eukprot:XP_024376684.1 uncharacterized protein LOC112282840 [Physcomitrella patens]
MSLLTSNVCDTHEKELASGELQVLTPGVFQSFGQKRIFSGRVVTVKVLEDNVLLRRTVNEPGNGRILVVDGGGSLRTALVGGEVAKLAETQGWAGFVIFGCIRDVDEINDCAIGVRALAPCPVRSKKNGVGEKNVVINIVGATIRPGDFCWVDNDGILVSTSVVPKKPLS